MAKGGRPLARAECRLASARATARRKESCAHHGKALISRFQVYAFILSSSRSRSSLSHLVFLLKVSRG